jgi:protein gp37
MLDHRYHRVEWGPHGERKRTSPANWRKPLQWAREANGTRPKVFCASLADVFDNRAPAGARDDLWALIRATPELHWMLLTKRPENIIRMLPADWGDGWSNIWLGTTCEDQAHFERRWPILRNVPAVIRFISYEPALGPLVIGDTHPDWIICGGESGAGERTRYMEPVWAYNLRDECGSKGIAFFLKQMTKEAADPRRFARKAVASGEGGGDNNIGSAGSFRSWARMKWQRLGENHPWAHLGSV